MRKIILIITNIIFIIILVKFCLMNNYKEPKINEEVNKFNIQSSAVNLENKKNMQLLVKVYISKSNQILELKLEDYVTGVVAAEMPVEFSTEALKAQAVAARTFALVHIEDKCINGKGADLCDTTHCQVYISKEQAIKSWPIDKGEKYWEKVIQAVNSTKDEILTYNGKMIRSPYYFSTSSGRTESALDIFKEEEPYLKSVESLGEEKSPEYISIKSIAFNDLIKIVNSSYPKAKITLGKIKNQIKILNNFQGGSVKTIKLGGVTISGVEFRNLFDIDSSNFVIEWTNKNIKITSKGYGHDVGMSQWGANVMAEKGSKYTDILGHYYQGTKVEKNKA